MHQVKIELTVGKFVHFETHIGGRKHVLVSDLFYILPLPIEFRSEFLDFALFLLQLALCLLDVAAEEVGVTLGVVLTLILLVFHKLEALHVERYQG